MDNTTIESGADGVLDLGDGLGGRRVVDVPLDRLRPDPEQPRRHFDEETIEELAQSMAMVGQLQAIGVRKTGEFWDIVYGERRWRAARLLGWTSIQAREFPVLGAAKLVLQAVENMHREELSLDEYAGIVLRLVEAGMPTAGAARALGRKESWARLMLQIARDPVARGLIDAGRLQSADAWEQFCALDSAGRRTVLDSTDPVTGPRCRQIQEQSRRAEEARQQSMALAPARQKSDFAQIDEDARIEDGDSEAIMPALREPVFAANLPYDTCLRLLPGMQAQIDEYFRMSVENRHQLSGIREVIEAHAPINDALVARIQALAGDGHVC